MSNGTPRSLWQPSDNGRRPERQQNVMPILKTGVLYFELVFTAGFVLATIRTLVDCPATRDKNGREGMKRFAGEREAEGEEKQK
jgi:hypothetical protein